ncbi:MAG: dethiobiotin synthase, partial [Gammaproteobacteria bacterium]|nr:dethiobiotin synthase [Gammaproteobacteria bacterium]
RHIAELVRNRVEKYDCLVVEGAGGWQAPLGRNLSMSDLALALELPVILVVGLRLGCLNHAALSAQAIRRSGLRLAGWVGNRIDPAMSRVQDNISTLEILLGARPLAVFPFGAEESERLVLGGQMLAHLVDDYDHSLSI